jgi:hypothetical protein
MEPMHQLAKTTTEGLQRDGLAFSALPDAPVRHPRQSRLGAAVSIGRTFISAIRAMAGPVTGRAAPASGRGRSRDGGAACSYHPS